MIKVLSIAPYRYLPVTTGGQKNIALFYKYFSNHVNLTCVTVKNNNTDNEGDYTILPLLSTSAFRYINLFYFFTLKRVIKQQEITHVMLEHPYYGWLGYLLKRFLKVKLVIRSHNIEGLRFKSLNKWWWKILWWYERKIHSSADFSFFITEEDQLYAIENFKIHPEKCTVITYGTEQEKAFSFEEKKTAKSSICGKYNLAESKPLLLYAAALNYEPNRKGLDIILNEILPLLLQKDFPFNILICGGGLAEHYNNLSDYKSKNLVYAGFVQDVSVYFKAADIFLNPICEGGGIKTKLVEALAANTAAASFEAGAYGIPLTITGNKLSVTGNNDTHAFCNAIETALPFLNENIPESFFAHFYWNNIAEKAEQKMKG